MQAAFQRRRVTRAVLQVSQKPLRSVRTSVETVFKVLDWRGASKWMPYLVVSAVLLALGLFLYVLYWLVLLLSADNWI